MQRSNWSFEAVLYTLRVLKCSFERHFNTNKACFLIINNYLYDSHVFPMPLVSCNMQAIWNWNHQVHAARNELFTCREANWTIPQAPQDHWHSEAFKYGISMLSCLSFWGSIDCSTQRRVSCMFDIPCLRFTWFLEIILVTMGYNSANILKLNFRSTAYGCDSLYTWESSNNANRKCRKCHVLSWKLRSNQS